MKFYYPSIIEYFQEKPSQELLSEKLFQLGHENEYSDDIFELELTPNRGDCLSLKGIARDLNIFFENVKEDQIYSGDIDELELDFKNIAISDCPKISFLEIEIDSPPSSYQSYLENYFKFLDINKSNFFTDISNYLSYEIGQPTHCFDRDKINGSIILENKLCNENFETLLKSTIKLNGRNLVFHNNKEILSLAGVMGGLSTSCDKNTNKVLIECAYFNPEAVIGKSIKYNLTSDAAHKFERGVDIEAQEIALRRFIKIVEDHVNIKSLKIKTYNNYKHHQLRLKIDNNKINRILGIKIDLETYLNYLKKLNFKIDQNINVPSFRHDISSQNDLAEEIARAIGYNNIDSMPFKICDNKSNNKSHEDALRLFLINLGFTEVINFPFTSVKSDFSYLIDNPLDSNKPFIRTDIKNSLIENLTYNERRQKDSIKLFEISNLYKKNSNNFDNLSIGIIASGRVSNDYRNFQKKIDKKYLDDIFEGLNIDFHEIPRDGVNSKHNSEIYYAEINLSDLNIDLLSMDKYILSDINFVKYKKISEFPSSTRDISFSISNLEHFNFIQNHFQKMTHINLKKIFIFDFYKNEKRDEIKLGYRFIFQSQNKTLNEIEINDSLREIIDPILKLDGVSIPGMQL